MKRAIVRIDEEKCDGCGQCIPSCPEGAIQIIDRKARLVSESYCDGLGACLGVCPRNAITIEEREAQPFDQEAVERKMKAEVHDRPSMDGRHNRSRNWPIQLKLVPTKAPCFDDAELVVSADCVAHILPEFHHTLGGNAMLVIGCPKLDDASTYQAKLVQILSQNNVKSIRVLHMEVPC